MADVAAHVGVSRQLVGLVFRNASGVSKKTEAKIRAAAKELGYRPNLAAQTLRGAGSNYIGVVFHTAHSSTNELVPAIYKHAEKHGFKVVLSAISSTRTDLEAVEEIIGHRCQGVILISSNLSISKIQSLSKMMPVESVSRRVKIPNVGVVASAGETGIKDAVKHLVSLGHKEIAYINAVDMFDGDFRLDGYRSGMSEAKLATKVIDINGDYVEAAGSRAAEKLLASKKLPTAVICSNDQIALGLVFSLTKAGLNVPQDVSVIGYDDTVAQLPFLNLTTVRQDPNEMAEAAVDDLVSRILGKKSSSEIKLTSSKLIVRSSTVKPKASK